MQPSNFPRSIIGKCDGCNVPNGVLSMNDGEPEYFCPKCMKHTALHYAAFDHLELLLEQAALAWLLTWEDGKYSSKINLREQMNRVGAQLEERFGGKVH